MEIELGNPKLQVLVLPGIATKLLDSRLNSDQIGRHTCMSICIDINEGKTKWVLFLSCNSPTHTLTQLTEINEEE